MPSVPIPWRRTVGLVPLLVPWLVAAQVPPKTVSYASLASSSSSATAALPPDQQVLLLERAWSRAIVRHNMDAIAEMLDDDYVRTSPDGRVHNKAEAILEFDRDADHYLASTFDNPQVRLYGDVAVVRAGGSDRGRAADGMPFNRRYRYTDVWVRRSGTWKCVASHSSTIAPTP